MTVSELKTVSEEVFCVCVCVSIFTLGFIHTNVTSVDLNFVAEMFPKILMTGVALNLWFDISLFPNDSQNIDQPQH